MRIAILSARIFSALMVMSVATGCGTSASGARGGIEGDRTQVEASTPKPPSWVVREPKSDERFHYFRGFRSDAPTLEDGETDARHNAMATIVQFLGLRVTVDYRRMRTEEKTAIVDAIRSEGGADIFGTRLNEMYYRRWRVRTATSLREAYDVYVLIRFPKSAISRIQSNQKARLKSIQKLVAGPGRLASPDRLYEQITGAAQALSALDKLNESVLITTETVGGAEGIRRQAQRRMTGILGSLQVSLSANRPETVSGRQRTPFILTARITTEGIRGTQPVPRIPVSISLGDTAHSKTAWTNAEGNAAWELHDLPFKQGSITATAQVDLSAAAIRSGDLSKSIPTASATFKIVPATAMTKLLVVVTEEAGGVRRTGHAAEARLLKALTEAGFTVVAPDADLTGRAGEDPWSSLGAARKVARTVGADVIVIGTFSVSKPIPVEMMPGIYYCATQVNLAISDVETARMLGSVAVPDHKLLDTKGFGPNPAKAISKALLLNRTRKRQPNGYEHIAKLIEETVRR